jgi:hypothetical protein
MTTVNLENWHFSFGGSHLALKGTPAYQASTDISLATHVNLLRYLADNDDHDSAIQGQLQSRLSADAMARTWHKQRTKIGSLPHFTEYRKTSKYDCYHAAAAAVFAGNATSKQHDMVQGLEQEVASSKIILSAGQVVFHGRGDQSLHTSQPYPSFISTSLDPVVCVWHAAKRRHQGGTGSKAFIYALTLRDDLPAIWGNGGGSMSGNYCLERN